MKSPFPGLDPYLEMHWGDAHQSLVTCAREALQPGLPADLVARMEERVFIEKEPDRIRRLVPDVHVATHPGWVARPAAERDTGTISVAEPIVFDLIMDPTTEGYVEIRERRGGKVITVIEFLSPANKSGEVGQEKYFQKQEEILSSDASLVEIDLVRLGRRVLAMPQIPAQFRNDLLVCISLGWVKGRRELYPMPLRQPLPVIPIPLRQGETRINLPLQQLADRVYAVGRFDLTDYTVEPEPPLSPEDAAWASELLKAVGRQ
ncbi:MAG: DUF4058 family protein [Verrucomicrobia bacterium]|nr:DUF4058 family protein [Verrucomicrobiota bacterium]